MRFRTVPISPVRPRSHVVTTTRGGYPRNNEQIFTYKTHPKRETKPQTNVDTQKHKKWRKEKPVPRIPAPRVTGLLTGQFEL